ncbi:MAG TPA: site-2 protease family protein [Acidimicrobiales bacterium]|nr:site-2 protease family protein [Acidimicrobiales bacterium]
MAAGPSFRIFGIPVRIDPTFLVIAALFGFGAGSVTVLLTWVAVLTVSVLVHELGHAVMFRFYGQRPQILLQGMGGLTWGSGPLTGMRDIVVSLAGPLAGIVLLGLPAILVDRSGVELSSTWDLVVRLAIYVNIVWSVVNLLPVLPLDGGNVTASLLRRVMGAGGQQAAHKVSIAVAAGAALFAYAQGQVFAAMFAAFFVAHNYGALKQERTLEEQGPLVEGYRALARKDVFRAQEQAKIVLAGAPPPQLAAAAVELRAWASLASTGAADATAVLADMPEGHTPNGFLTGMLALDGGRVEEAMDGFAVAFAEERFGPWSPIVADAVARRGLVGELVERLVATAGAGTAALVHLQSHLHDAGRYQEAATVGKRAFDARPDEPARVAYNVACSLACVGDEESALEWLERAAEAGFVDRTTLDNDPDLEPLRRSSRYQAVRERLGSG